MWAQLEFFDWRDFLVAEWRIPFLMAEVGDCPLLFIVFVYRHFPGSQLA